MTPPQQYEAERDAMQILDDMQDCPSITPIERAAVAVLLALVCKLESENARLLIALQREARFE